MTLPHDEVGDGDALILLHAGVADRSMWREHLRPLADAGYRVVALDLPGYGEAPPSATESAPWVDVVETMNALAIDRATLVGNSFGGAVALRVALVAPERVTALALISAPPPDLEEPSPQLRAAWDAENEALERGDIEAAVQAVVDAWTLHDAPVDLRDRVATMQRRALIWHSRAREVHEAADPREAADPLEAAKAPDPPEAAVALDPLEAAVAADPLEAEPGRLAEIAVPALLAAGERDVSDFRDGALKMARQLPNARHVELKGAGHLAPLETPAEFRELLLEFLAGL